jgi:sortase (surface protein transpeptidase)
MFRQTLFLFILLLIVLLSGCVGASSTQNVMLPTSQFAKHPSQKAVKLTSAAVKVETSASQPSNNPVSLLIPSINVNAQIESLAALSNGDLATPTQSPWTDVGWYDVGTQPGEPGSAVIDGHLDRPGGYPAVFWNLRYLHPGDSVLVQTAKGQTLTFRVLRVVYYPPQEAPLQAIFGNSGGKYLNLITCAGDWIPSQHQTTLRLVVYTVLA